MLYQLVNHLIIQLLKHLLSILALKCEIGYGQTKNTLLIRTFEHIDLRPGSMGMPNPANDVRIIDPNGSEAPIGKVGDIAVYKSSPALFKEYYREQERTQVAFHGDWCTTGDQAKRDEDGYFWFEGRGDDIIISSGYTIGLFEVEDALNKHEVVQECAVVAAPDEIRRNTVI